ncbi:hypothetical protein E0L36_22135 [Streptomyces sp. AJS327]|uniref:hypothetical protein n=1 Tax=Streptomyces sp. AJS327 TaxID=2545265 RepID=UPI0015DDF4F7|nr:hypothetical protein [Streptomyces sp. AJS327]MBA0053477.1 hypothetical protein [Streptomyces sp. AJS327]
MTQSGSGAASANQAEDFDQPRIPGVRYRKETRCREEVVEIDGQPEPRTVEYTVWVPVPPRDWDRIIVNALTCAAIIVTLLAVTGTTAGIGTLLAALIPAFIAYGVALIFDVVWLACVAVEWLERLDPARAKAARTAGWVSLGISMGAVIAFGHHYNETVAGVVGSMVSLLAKGLWVFVLRYHAVPLSDSVAFWLNRRRQKAAASLALAKQMRRLDAYDAYMAAAFGPEAARAHQISARTAPALSHLADAAPWTVPDPSGTPSGHAAPPAPTSGPLPDQGGQEEDSGPDNGDETVLQFEKPAKAETIRAALIEDAAISDEDLLTKVIKVHGKPATEKERRRLAETVRRTRQRIEKKSKAS